MHKLLSSQRKRTNNLHGPLLFACHTRPIPPPTNSLHEHIRREIITVSKYDIGPQFIRILVGVVLEEINISLKICICFHLRNLDIKSFFFLKKEDVSNSIN